MIWNRRIQCIDKNLCPLSSRVSKWASEWMSAAERASSSEQANGGEKGPVLYGVESTRWFHSLSTQCALLLKYREIVSMFTTLNILTLVGFEGESGQVFFENGGLRLSIWVGDLQFPFCHALQRPIAHHDLQRTRTGPEEWKWERWRNYKLKYYYNDPNEKQSLSRVNLI